jgi:stage V sporulation protein AA
MKDIAQILAPGEWVNKINDIVMIKAKSNQDDVIVIEILEVIAKLQQLIPNVQIQYYGDLETIIEIKKKPQTTNWFFVGFATILLFFGAGLAVMDFHADVAMAKVHRTLYTLLTGKTADFPLWLQIPYSIGLGGGMILFFNRWFTKKINNEPNPLDVEMQTYQDNINKCVITQQAQLKSARSDR